MFKNERTSVTDAERSGRPATATTTRYEERTLELIRENIRIAVEEVAGRLNVTIQKSDVNLLLKFLINRVKEKVRKLLEGPS